jgi:bis(5'-nucleosyl)-tetraphosphatase (symmetrical)
MAIFAIGDIQGCYDELARLVDKLSFDPDRDELWFVGDLVNRGPRSLDVLRFVRSLKESSTVVLGNHDLHLLAARENPDRIDKPLRKILAAHDADELLHWLRHQPLVHYRPDLNTLMVHAGIHPTWDLLTTVNLAREAEQIIGGKKYRQFLSAMYSDKPSRWSPDLSGIKRIRFIINCLTRIRFCRPNGELDFIQKGPPKKETQAPIPWFDFPDRANRSVRIVCGHWSSLGLINNPKTLMIDTGCVWGRELTAARIDGSVQIVSVKAKKTK